MPHRSQYYRVMTNPFDELDLDPRLSPDELTDALRRRAEKAEGADRARIQELWRVLTLNERDRVRWAFFAHPRSTNDHARSIDALREKVPPVISREKFEPIEPRVEDALVFSADEDLPGPPLDPPSLFDRES